MKRFSRLPSMEILEEKRLKAADLAACAMGHDPAALEAADSTAACVSVTNELRAANLEQVTTSTASAAAKEEDGSDGTDENETNGTDDNGTDGTDDNGTDGTDDNGTDGTDDNGTDGTDDNDSNDNGSDDQEMNFSTTLMGTTAAMGTASAESESEDGSTKTEFEAKVTGATANQTLQVTVGSTVVGTITTDAQGNGSLKLASDPDDDEQALPADFPTIDATTTISIGVAGQAPILTGTFATAPESASLTQVSGTSGGSLLGAPAGVVGTSSVHAASNRLSAISAAAPSAVENETLDPNLMDVDTATGQPLDSWRQTEFQPNHGADDTVVDGSPIQDALFEALAKSDEFYWAV